MDDLSTAKELIAATNKTKTKLNRISYETFNSIQVRNLYLYKIESRIFVTGVRIERQCEALHMICLWIQHEVESDMG